MRSSFLRERCRSEHKPPQSKAAVLGVFDRLGIRVPVGGTDNADGVSAVLLDFEVQTLAGVNHGHNIQILHRYVKYIIS